MDPTQGRLTGFVSNGETGDFSDIQEPEVVFGTSLPLYHPPPRCGTLSCLPSVTYLYPEDRDGRTVTLVSTASEPRVRPGVCGTGMG